MSARALRFCMVTTFYPPFHFGGDAINVQRFARALVRRGHHVTVVHDVDAFEMLDRSGTPPPPREPADGVQVIALRSGMGTLSPLLTHQLGRPVVHGRRLRALFADGDFDVVNFHNVSLVGGAGVLSYAPDAVTVYTAHEHWLVCPTHVLWRHQRELCDGRECVRCTLRYGRPPQLWRYTGYLERQLRGVDVVIAMSEFSRQKHREFGLTRDMEVLPCFLPDRDATRESAPPWARPFFLFAGRLQHIKGVDDVIPLFRDLPEIDLLVAGDGEDADALRALATGIPNVRFLGRVTSDELRRYYRHALALIVPSRCYETFGVVIIESFREGTPVLARRIGPFPEIVSESGGGELFETREQLLAAMRRLQRDPAHRARLAAAGSHAYETRYSERAVIPRYLEIVRAGAERRGHDRVAAALTPDLVRHASSVS